MLGKPEAPLPPLRFFGLSFLIEELLPVPPFMGLRFGLQVQHLLIGNFPPQPLQVCDQVQPFLVQTPVLK